MKKISSKNMTSMSGVMLMEGLRLCCEELKAPAMSNPSALVPVSERCEASKYKVQHEAMQVFAILCV